MLEGTLAPAVASSVLFDALERWQGGVPRTGEEVLQIVQGPLSEVLAERLGDAGRDSVIQLIQDRLVQLAGALDLVLEVATPPAEAILPASAEAPEEVQTKRIRAVNHAVGVLVASSSTRFAPQLTTAIGAERVFPLTVHDVSSLRHEVFAMNPQLLVLDGAAPPPIAEAEWVQVLRGLPDHVLIVIWDAGTDFGRRAVAFCSRSDHASLGLLRSEGIEPLLDLVLARFHRASDRSM